MAQHMATQQERKPPVGIALAIGVALLVVVVGAIVWRNQGTGEAQRAASGDSAAERAAQPEPVPEQEKVAEPEPEPASELARLFQQKEVHSIRLVGDSITAGFGTDGYTDPNLSGEGRVIYDDGAGKVYRETPETVACWANAFREYAREHGVGDFANAGINGAFMKELAQNPNAWLGDGADVIFVALGTNDAGYYGPDEFRSDAQAALSAVAQKSKLVVVLSPVRDLRPLEQLVEPAGDLGDVLQALCDDQGYLFVDPRDAVTPDMFNVDDLHPTTEGSLAIWECIRQTLGL